MRIDVLDQGYVEYVEHWGRGQANVDEAGIIEAARQSTQGTFRGWDQDEKLLTFLFNQRPPHSGPFEFAGLVLKVHAPIMVYREWHRHRTQSYAEASARYAPLKPIDYIPSMESLMLGVGSQKNKQAAAMAGAAELTEAIAQEFQHDLILHCNDGEDLYQYYLKNGVRKEQARLFLQFTRYSTMSAHANLRNWLAFLTLRADPGAQWEIQQYANAVGKIIEAKFPYTWKLFEAAKHG